MEFGASDDVAAADPGFPLSKAATDAFSARSAALGNILAAGEIARILAAYRRENWRAMEAQRRFASVATHLNASVLATGVIGSLILAFGLLQPWLGVDVDPRFTQIVPAVLGFVGLLRRWLRRGAPL